MRHRAAEIGDRLIYHAALCARGQYQHELQVGAAHAQLSVFGRHDLIAAGHAGRIDQHHASRQRGDARSQLVHSGHRFDAYAEYTAEAAQLLVGAQPLVVGGEQQQIGRILLEYIARCQLGKCRGLAGTGRTNERQRAAALHGRRAHLDASRQQRVGHALQLFVVERCRQLGDDLQRE